MDFEDSPEISNEHFLSARKQGILLRCYCGSSYQCIMNALLLKLFSSDEIGESNDTADEE